MMVTQLWVCTMTDNIVTFKRRYMYIYIKLSIMCLSIIHSIASKLFRMTRHMLNIRTIGTVYFIIPECNTDHHALSSALAHGYTTNMILRL